MENLNPFTDIDESQADIQLEKDILADIARSDSTLLLAESSRQGYVIDPVILQDFVKQYTAEVSQLKKELFSEIRQALGWAEQADVLNELPDQSDPES